MKKINILYAVLFVALFIIIQEVVTIATTFIYASTNNTTTQAVLAQMAKGGLGQLTVAISVVSSLLTILLFQVTRWVPMSANYLRSKPWGVLIWTILLTLGTILPSEWLAELVNLEVPESTGKLFEGIMKEPWGYAAIGLLVPIAEEIVFRGGVLGRLLAVTGKKNHWVAIIISALVFGCVHFNLAQGTHAFVIGLLLGWMYYRTGSLIPGVVFHWINNSVAYIMFNLMPQMADGKLIDLFHGNNRMMGAGIIFSLCILVPSIFQLSQRMKR